MKSKFKAFENLDECVASAVEVFAEQGWTWATVGVPDEHRIRGTLCDLAKRCRGSDRAETGRLAYSDGVFYHQIPPGYDERRSALEKRDEEIVWHKRLVELVEQIISDQNDSLDVLASASWDEVVEHWKLKGTA